MKLPSLSPLALLSSSLMIPIGFRFILPRAAALGSGLVSDAITSDFAEASTNTITLTDQRPEIVDKVAEYLMYKERYSHSKETVPDFKDRVKPETALEL